MPHEGSIIGDKLLETLAEGENVLFVIKRHPIGLVPIYSFIIFGTVITIVVLNLLSSNPDIAAAGIPSGIWGFIAILVIIFVFIAGGIGRRIYWSNELIVTEENIIQILRPTLLLRKVSQLNLGKVQDVSVDQKGFFQLFFKYGTIMVETAGEAASYKFAYSPHPNRHAAKIIQAHDAYIALHGPTTDI